MPTKIRLQRKGRKKAPFYHIVVADSRESRDGRFIEKLGVYNPLTSPATIELDRDKAFDWMQKGAQPTDTARAILKFNGLYYRKHLQRGVAKGALTQEQADAKYQEWVANKDQRIEARRDAVLQEMEAQRLRIFGAPKAKPKAEEAPVAEAETPSEETSTEEAGE